MKTENPEQAALDKAYRATTYRVFLPSGVVDLRIGEANAALAAWLAEEEVDCWALLTAHNPGGQRREPGQNAEAQAQLECLLLEAEYEPFAGENLAAAADSNVWPDEETCFVPLLESDEAMALANQFGQNAFVAGAVDGVPHLIWVERE